MKTIYKLLFSSFLFLLVSQSAIAQTITIPDTLSGWNQSWVAGLNGSQASYSNWSQGGVSSVSGTASSVLSLLYKKGQYGYGFRLNLKYGQSNIKGQGVRKTDDVISIRNRFAYTFESEGDLSAFATAKLETQFARGYEYDAAVAGGDSLISDFFAPAYFTESIGIAYQPNDNLTFEGGLGLKHTVVIDDDLAPVYGLDPGNNLRNEVGLTTGISYENEVFDEIVYATSLETFTNFMTSIDKTDVIWKNELVGRINRLVNASFQFELRYDDDFSSEIQLKQVLSAGISVNLY
ncbi:MAG: DUF3078 domain-containing protein [Balneolaceae bacterium]